MANQLKSLKKSVARLTNVNKLYGEDIYPGVHYIDNTTYKMYNYAYGTCPNAHKLSKQLLTLPIHLELKEEDIVRISKIINQYG